MAGVLAKLAPGLLSLLSKGVPAAAIITGLYYVILVALHLITDLLLRLGGVLIKSAISWNSDIIKSSFVKNGHDTVLLIANTAFIVALVVIAFATMLQSESFGYRKALPRLIAAALLINFGYFIVTKWLIEPTNQIITSLTNAANFGEITFSNTFDPRGAFSKIDIPKGDLDNSVPDNQKTKEVDENKAAFLNSVPGFVKKLGGILALSLASIAFAFVGIIALFAFAAMLFIRGIVLSFLIILLPIAWVAWIFPNLKIPGGNPWVLWWENFTRWLLFGPFAIFFLYLAVQLTKEGPLPAAVSVNGGISSAATAVGGAIAVIGFMIGGLIISNKLGITGSSYALAVASKGRAWAQIKAKQIGLKAGYGAYKGVRGDEAAKQLQNVGVGKWWGGLAAPIRATGRQATRTVNKAEAARQDFLKKKFEGLAPFQIADMYEGLNDEEKMAAAQHMVDRGFQWELSEQWTKDLARWQREGTFNKRGRRKLQLDAFDKGYDAQTLAAIEDEEALLAIADPAQRVQEAQRRHFSDEDLRRLTDDGLRERTEKAAANHVRILGHKGIPNIDPRILSAESRALSSKDPVTGERDFTERGRRVANLYVDSVMEHMPTAAPALYGRTRGRGAPFMVEKTEEWIKKWNERYLTPKMSEIIARLPDEEKKDKTADEIKEIVLAASRERKIEWVNATWDERTANRAATQLGAYMQTGKRALFFPVVGGEAPTPPA